MLDLLHPAETLNRVSVLHAVRWRFCFITEVMTGVGKLPYVD